MALNRIAKPRKQPTLRSFMPLIVGGMAGIVLLIGLLIFFVTRPGPVEPSQEELAADTANGLKYERGDGVAADYAQAQDWYRRAAEHGYPPAELSLGILYMTGRGVVKDEKAAAKWFIRAADHGSPEGQVAAAGNYMSGTGVAVDRVEAMKWLLLGADVMPDEFARVVAQKTRDSLAATLGDAENNEARKRAADWTRQRMLK